jgi:predicted glycogen debranching enzyme
MLPNRFVESGAEPEFNSVDASLWFVIAVHEYLQAAQAAGQKLLAIERASLNAAIQAILHGCSQGTRYGIRADDDGLLAAGEPGWQLTWMDARAWGREITPRSGKPVEIQALWLNALAIGAAEDPRWRALFERGRKAFTERFWNEARSSLFDVIDVEHVRGRVDGSLRPNQLLALGGLPISFFDVERGRRAVDTIERELWTPLGLRSLAPGEPGYAERYVGGPDERDAVYHQGTVWPWWIGPFVDAWLRVRGNDAQAKREARARFLTPLFAHLEEAGLGHVSEIADAQAPHTPRGAPFQAWSLGELLRLDRVVLAPSRKHAAPRAPAAG